MKKYLLIFSIFFGCNQNTEKVEPLEIGLSSVDSLINQSKKNLISLDSASKSTDSSISGKVEKTAKQITNLKEENIKLKKENETLKEQLNDAVDVGKPFKLLPVSNGKDNR